MIVFFEDGPIKDNDLFLDEQMFKVDAGMGFSYCRDILWMINNNFSFDTKVYTNSLYAFSNCWCWNEEKQTPMIYVRDKNYNWKLISELTTRELRRAINLEKLYINGEFVDM